MAPIVKMFTLGSDFIPPKIYAGGLRYHGMAPTLSALADAGYIEAVSVSQRPVFDAAMLFSRCEGIIPAPETAHAIRATIDEALEAKKTGEKKVILFNLSGHGHFDLSAFQNYLSGEMVNYDYPDEAITKLADRLPEIPG